MSRNATKYEYVCDLCGETEEHDDGLPEGWVQEKKKDYCEECAVIVDHENADKYPATFIVHCPTGPLYACLEHANYAAGLYKFMGAHVTAQMTHERVACINCINEAKDKKEEA